MPREYPTHVTCPSCGETLPRHCVKNNNCGWFMCLAESRMYALGTRNPVTRKYAVLKFRTWTALR